MNYADHVVTPPFISATATGGVYFGAVAYYNGMTWDAGSQALLSLGNIAGSTREISVCGNCARGKDGGTTLLASLSDPVNPGWYICIAYLSKSGSTNTMRFLRSGDDPIAAPSTNTSAFDFTAATWSTLRIGQLAASSASMGGANVPIDCVFAGRGNPAAFLDWMYNGGKIRRPTGYNFGTDPNGCTMNFFIDLARTAGGAWDATQLVDTYGVYSSWTFTVTPPASADTNKFAWLGRKPSFVMPFGDPLPTPPAYISPGYGTTDDIYTIESGLYAVAPIPAWTAKSYAMNNKVTNGGQTYRCLEAHISTTFAADLAAGKWGLFSITVNSLTHSVLGDIRASLVGYAFTCATPGVVTANVTLNGTTLNITSEIFAAQTMPAVPQYASAFGGNGLVAAIEPYPTPAGSGTSYATVGALATALSSLTAGSTLIVNDLNDLNGATLTIPARNYGGATVICKNWEGVKVAAISMAGASNLTLIGFAVKGAISGNLMDGNITLDHCRAANLDLDGSGGHELTFNLTFTNHLCWEPSSGIPNGYTRFTRINRLTGYRWVMYGIDNTVAVFQMYKVGLVFMDRFFAGDAQYNGDTHPDLMQLTANNAQGWTGGYFRNGFGFQRVGRAGTKGFQGLFLTDNRLQHLLIKNVIMDVEYKASIVLSGSKWNVRLEDCIGSRMINIKPGYPNACLARNNVLQDAVNYANANILTTPALGYETGNLGLTLAGLTKDDLWPQYTARQGSWRAFANPNTGYETRGAAAMVAELEAKRVALGI